MSSPGSVSSPKVLRNMESINYSSKLGAQVVAHTFGSEPFSLKEKASIGTELCTPPPRQEISFKPGPYGKRIFYMEGWKLIHEANRIFGFDGWSSTVLDTSHHFAEKLEDGKYSVCCTALVRVTLKNGITREDRGGGTSSWSLSKGESIISAEKEAVTDATKRALRSFGPRFGLCLRDPVFIQHLRRQENRPIGPVSPIEKPRRTELTK